MADYDISGAFGRIEDELIAYMIRNFDRHRAEETDYGFNWAQWQAEQLKALERYRRENRKKFGPEFQDLNIKIEQAIREMEKKGGADAEREILRQIQRGYTPPGDGTKGAFFRTNRRKLDALVKATTDDMSKAETAILRMANDKYRKAIFDAQVYANSGAGTYEKAVDMATKDMAAAGLNCVEYKNGARHRLEDYADMAIRTANKRAYLYGEGERRKAWGVTTVIVNKRTDACPQCLPFCGKVFIDDVWSGGVAEDAGYPLISSAIEAGFLHPRCKDSFTTWFPGVSTAEDKWTKEEIEAVEKKNKEDAYQNYARNQVKKYTRLCRYSLDETNAEEYKKKAMEWHRICERPRYKDITEEALSNATPGVGSISSRNKYHTKGHNYTVDGVNVVLDPEEKEKNVAQQWLDQFGGKIEFIPRIVKPSNISTPDYKINGERYDLKTIDGESKDVVYNAIHKKREQSENFIIQMGKTTLTIEEIISQAERIYDSKYALFVDKLFIMSGGKVIKVFKRR